MNSSGDTAPSDTLIQLARGADVLVHEANRMWVDAAQVHFRGPVIVGKDLLEV